jgi:hypothetical protein
LKDRTEESRDKRAVATLATLTLEQRSIGAIGEVRATAAVKTARARAPPKAIDNAIVNYVPIVSGGTAPTCSNVSNDASR